MVYLCVVAAKGRRHFRNVCLDVFVPLMILNSSNVLQGHMKSLFSKSSVETLLEPDLSHLGSTPLFLFGLENN